jgi:SAM-dependent methyltransferase
VQWRAEAYDALETENRLLRRGREASLRALFAAMPQRGRLLELGCGTGTEAVAVAARLRCRVVAYDPTPAFVETATMKATASAMPVEVRRGTASQALQELVDGGERFDGVWASFSLAYDAPLGKLAPSLAAVLGPGAPFVFSLPNPWVLMAPWRIPKRRRGLYRHKVGTSRPVIRCRSYAQAVHDLAGWFEPESAQGLNVLVPPGRFHRAWKLTGPIGRWMESLDDRVAGRRGWRRLGDHTLFVFRRSATEVPGA